MKLAHGEILDAIDVGVMDDSVIVDLIVFVQKKQPIGRKRTNCFSRVIDVLVFGIGDAPDI